MNKGAPILAIIFMTFATQASLDKNYEDYLGIIVVLHSEQRIFGEAKGKMMGIQDIMDTKGC